MIDHAKQDKDYFFSSFYVSLFLAVLKFARYRAALPSYSAVEPSSLTGPDSKRHHRRRNQPPSLTVHSRQYKPK